MAEAMNELKKGRRMLLFLVVLFALPVLVVVLMYRFDVRPSGSSHGQLITPPVELRLPSLHTAQGTAFQAAQWKTKWSIVFIDSSGCTQSCQEHVHLLRQVHVALNKEIDRVQRILILNQPASADTLTALTSQYPDLAVLSGNDVAPLVRQFDLPGQPAATSERVYLVDPLGNLMMSYPKDYNPKGLLDDLTRLLKYSWVG